MRILLCIVLLITACEKVKYQTITKEVEKVIEKVAPVDMSLYPDAKLRLAEHLVACGEGVVENYVPDCKPGEPCPVPENRCGYTIKVDAHFLQPEVAQTGYEEDVELVRSNGSQWQAPTPEELAAVPTSWDFLTLGKASQVKINRQQCGDCWSQASTKALEYMAAAHLGKILDLSVQTQISRCSNHGSCGGGYMTAPDFLVEYGNPYESQDPYQGRNSSCAFSSQELSQGFETKPEAAPWVGRSLNYSRFYKQSFRGNTAREIQAMMVKHQSPAVVTIAAISQSSGIIRRCSSINSGGNHMQVVVGWYQDGSDEIAKLNNSWGTSHGQGGFTHIKWECDQEGKLNRGIGRSARVYVMKPECPNQPNAEAGKDVQFVKTSPNHGVLIGHTAKNVQGCTWTPSAGLQYLTSDHCLAFASPDATTEYHLTARTECGEASSMVLVTPLGPMRQALSWEKKGHRVITPLGEVWLDNL